MNKLKLYISVLSALFLGVNVYAQTSVELHISHKTNGTNDYVKGIATENDKGDKFTITRFEYYISKISITHDGGTVTDIPNHYILANAENDVKEDLGSHNITNVESVSFYIGVDTPNNHADPTKHPANHPLYPKFPSMHWGWTDGYRFVAMEGKAGASMNEVYEVHSLGDNYYYQTTVTTTGITSGGEIIIPIKADIAEAVRGIDVKPSLIEHGFSATNIKLLENMRDNVFKPWFAVSVDEITRTKREISIYPNPAAEGNAVVDFVNNTRSAIVTVSDIQGRIVSQIEKSAGNSKVDLSINQPGMYFVTAQFSDGSKTATQKLIVQ